MLEKRIPGHDRQHDGADGQLADSAPQAARKGAAARGPSFRFGAAFPRFTNICSDKCAARRRLTRPSQTSRELESVRRSQAREAAGHRTEDRKHDTAPARALLGGAGRAGAKLNDLADNGQDDEHADGGPRQTLLNILRNKPRVKCGCAPR